MGYAYVMPVMQQGEDCKTRWRSAPAARRQTPRRARRRPCARRWTALAASRCRREPMG